jgi:nucleoid-associated protein YgaU
MANEPNKADFSNVQAGTGTTSPPAKADFGNVESGSASSAPAAAASAAKTYTVVRGDSLSKIAKHIYGNANRWHDIFEANRDQLANPDLIQPGQILKLPADAGSGSNA